MNQACDNNGKVLNEVLQRDDLESISREEAAHFEVCATCRAELDKARRLDTRMRDFASKSLESMPVRAFVMPKSAAKSEYSFTEKLAGWFSFRNFAMAATIFIVCAGAWFLLLKKTDSRLSDKSTMPGNKTTVVSFEPDRDEPVRMASGFNYPVVGQKYVSPDRSLIKYGTSVIEVEDAEFTFLDKKVDLLRGRLVAEITPGQAFAVITPLARIEVLGTRFSVVVAANGSTGVSVKRGSVKVIETGNSSERILTAGMSADIRPRSEKTAADQPEKKIEPTVRPMASESIETDSGADNEDYQEPSDPLSLNDLIGD